MGGGGCRKFESFFGNLGGFAPPPAKSEFPPLFACDWLFVKTCTIANYIACHTQSNVCGNVHLALYIWLFYCCTCLFLKPGDFEIFLQIANNM